jgi:hypothetical protein
MQYGRSAAVLGASGLVERDPLCRYLFGFCSLMAGAVAEARKALDPPRPPDDANTAFMFGQLAAMLERAEALARTTPLDGGALAGRT